MPPSTRRPHASSGSRLSRSDVLEACRRYYDYGQTQGEIAARFGISSSYLARVLQNAKDHGWVRVYVDADEETELAAALRTRFPHLRHVEVIRSRPEVPEAARISLTAADIGLAMANWLNDLLDEDDERDERQIHNVAVGGGAAHAQLVEHVVRRKNRISVGPTALTPTPAKVARFTAPMVAQQLALRLGALSPGDANAPGVERTGFLYSPSRLVVPHSPTLEEVRNWWRTTERDPDYEEMLQFWKRTDVAFVSTLATEWAYDDVKRRLTGLGTSLDTLMAAGAVAILANQFVREDGSVVPLAERVPSYEPAIPVDALRSMVAHQSPAPRYVVLDDWGDRGVANAALLSSGLFNVLFCDTTVAAAIK